MSKRLVAVLIMCLVVVVAMAAAPAAAANTADDQQVVVSESLVYVLCVDDLFFTKSRSMLRKRALTGIAIQDLLRVEYHF